MQDVTKKKYEQLFKQKKHLGTGSFGRVIKSSSKVDGKTYAVKLMQNVSSMFLDGIGPQAQAMMRAKSDYTVQLLQHFYDQQSSTYVFVMPYYSKGNLSQYLQKKWNRLDILSFLYQICQAFLSFSKQGACWHLDLKPDNILVKNQGEYLICDFGCAKLVDNINISRFLQMSLNRGLGTTSYAAPQIIIKMEGGKYSDIWSVGIILYKILYNTHPLQKKQKKQAYRQIIEQFASGKQKIQYPPKPGYQQIIQLCKQILKPQKRLQWQQLKKAIYQCIGLPLKTQIVVNLQKFISYAQNVSKIVMGLVFYLQKNEQNLNKQKIAKDAQRVISISKAYISLLYRQVQNTIQSETSNQKLNKNDVKSYYIFPQTRKNYSIQQKQRLIHLRAVAQNFCLKQYKENEKVNFLNIKMNFQSQIQQFISILRMENLDKLELHPFSQWHKIGQICNFIVRGNQQKTPGLQYVDRNQIEKFAYKIVYQ